MMQTAYCRLGGPVNPVSQFRIAENFIGFSEVWNVSSLAALKIFAPNVVGGLVGTLKMWSCMTSLVPPRWEVGQRLPKR